ncbi:MAG: 3-isopropylmalate dehydratase small subunit [Planctomycetes bacterium]|nr:3-isopropylmalate dehydratase small subunit [Planctomycetota bacterium]
MSALFPPGHPLALPTLSATIFVVGDDIDTDVIIPARYLSTFKADELAHHAFEDLDPKQYPVKYQAAGVSPYAVVVGGRNFGCGSSREHAPIALKGAGCRVVIAESFANIFYRNCLGGAHLVPVVAAGAAKAGVRTGDTLTIVWAENRIRLGNGGELTFQPLSGVARDLLEAGGLEALNRKRLAAGATRRAVDESVQT